MKRIISLALTLTLLFLPAQMIKAETTEPIVTYYENKMIGPLASSIVNNAALYLTKNSCSITYTFLETSSGSITAKLEKLSGSNWNLVESTYSSYSFTKFKTVDISVSNLSAGKYRVSSDIYAVIAGTEYRDSIVTGTYTLN